VRSNLTSPICGHVRGDTEFLTLMMLRNVRSSRLCVLQWRWLRFQKRLFLDLPGHPVMGNSRLARPRGQLKMSVMYSGKKKTQSDLQDFVQRPRST
jgi:hypothetical protein